MKGLYEHFISFVVMILLVFGFLSINLASSQLTLARRVHSKALNYVSSSYFAITEEELNDSLSNMGADKWGWYFTIENVYDNPEFVTKELVLHYSITVPVFDVVQENTLSAYVR